MNCQFVRILTGSIALFLTSAVSQAAEYNWTATVGDQWTDAVNWNSAGVPVAGDTANLNDTATDRIIFYPAGGTGSVGTINFNQTSAATNTLDIQRNLTVSTGITLGTDVGMEELKVSPQGASGTTTLTVPTLTIQNGGRFVLGIGTTNNAVSQLSGNLVMTGGELFLTDSLPPNGAAQRTITGTATVSGGTIRIGTTTATSGTTEARLQFSSNATFENATINGAPSAQFILNGASSSLASTVTLGSSIQTVLSSSSQSQTFTSGIALNSLFLRAFNTGNFVRTVTVNVPGQNLGPINFATQQANSSITLKLGSNLTTKTNTALPVMSGVSQNSPVTLGIDAAGFTLDLSATTSVWTLNEAGQGTGGGVVTWALSNSGTAGAGRIKAHGFNFATPDNVTVGAGLVLEAGSGNNIANNLSGGGDIAPTSVFHYTGGAAAATPSTLTSNRPLGLLEIGNGTSTGSLRLNGSITAAGAVKVNDHASFDLGTQTLTPSNGVRVEAGATLRGGNSTTAGTISGNVSASGTLSPGTTPAASGTTIGTISISNLLSVDTGSQFALEIVSASSFDKIVAGSVELNDAVELSLSFGASYAHIEGTTFRIIENTGTDAIGGTSGQLMVGGSEGRLSEGEVFTVNGNAFTISYAGGTGNDVVLTAVPEPRAWLALVTGVGMLASWRRFRRLGEKE